MVAFIAQDPSAANQLPILVLAHLLLSDRLPNMVVEIDLILDPSEKYSYEMTALFWTQVSCIGVFKRRKCKIWFSHLIFTGKS